MCIDDHNSRVPVSIREVRHDEYRYTYSPCSNNSHCGNGKAAVRNNLLVSRKIIVSLILQICRHFEINPVSHEVIGLLDSVSYSVKDQIVVATYAGEDG